ncbi:MAG: hypothetical protein JSW10_11015 [Pseudomonadota bacterium]|nr:MAG: hypothetical protein JSW10_11015 [Pseudomonadota bacterium]
MKKPSGIIISIVGLGLVVGALTTTLGLQTVVLSIGLGLMLGGVFKEIHEIKNKID